MHYCMHNFDADDDFVKILDCKEQFAKLTIIQKTDKSIHNYFIVFVHFNTLYDVLFVKWIAQDTKMYQEQK